MGNIISRILYNFANYYIKTNRQEHVKREWNHMWLKETILGHVKRSALCNIWVL